MTFVHHSAGPQCFDKESCISVVQGIQNYHMDGNGWTDIGYSFLIGEDGRVYEGCGWDVIGAHTLNYNSISNGFCVLGDFTGWTPNELALNATQSIISCGVELGYIIPNYELFGHRDGRCTECPGDAFYAEIQTWPPYSTRPIPIYC
jgi:peptidoglycan recognition protein